MLLAAAARASAPDRRFTNSPSRASSPAAISSATWTDALRLDASAVIGLGPRVLSLSRVQVFPRICIQPLQVPCLCRSLPVPGFLRLPFACLRARVLGHPAPPGPQGDQDRVLQDGREAGSARLLAGAVNQRSRCEGLSGRQGLGRIEPRLWQEGVYPGSFHDYYWSRP